MTDKKIIISASRRTDIPAFHMPWFMKGVEKRRFLIKNPFSKKVSTLIFTPENIQAVFFWSKDYTQSVKKKILKVSKKEDLSFFSIIQ